MEREKFERLTVRLKPTLRQDVERLADEDELPVATYVRRLIAAHVKSVGADRVAA
jgi:predicted DNA-binding protein